MPILRGGEPVGVLCLANGPRAGEFDAHDQRAMELLARHAAIAIDHARAHERITREVAERARLQEELLASTRELERLRDEWTSLIAHDLRQPVTVIGLVAGTLKKSLAQRPEGPRVLHIIEAARQLDRMISDLLDISRLEAKQLSLELRATDLAALVREVIERMSEALEGRSVRVWVEGAVPPFAVDPGRIEQVLGNLLSNAVKYGEPGTEIGIAVEGRGAEVQIAVTNRGDGIAPEELGMLFQRFRRARAVRGQRTPGLGLGLYIAKGLVEAHGGRIWAESIPGEITRFRFALPVAPAPSGEASG